MASSRLERVGTIYSRITGLLRSGALKPENKPIWYDVYQQFPPKFQPRVDRAVPNVEVTPIFYPEDVIRAKLAKEKSSIIGTYNLSDSRQTNTQKCIEYYEEFKKECSNEDEAFAKAVEKVAAEMPIRKEVQESEPVSLSDEFKKAKRNNVKLTDIFN